jgi:N-acetyl-gamma-glutamyl-phosphate reductase common form
MSIHAVILGATGYVGGELLRLIAGHPEFELAAAVSGSMSGKPVGQMFPQLENHYVGQSFCSMDDLADSLDGASHVAIFSAAPHKASAGLVGQALAVTEKLKVEAHVVDSSADFRYKDAADFEKVYGVPHEAPNLLGEFSCAVPEHAAAVDTPHVGHPGCFATAMLLATVPLYKQQLTTGPVFISGVTGSTGSGRSPQAGTHHPERHSNLYAYKPLSHRHVPEVENLIKDASGQSAVVKFIPHSGPFARGIYVTVQAMLSGKATRNDILQAFESSYANSIFVNVVDGTPKLKNVVASNYVQIGVDVSDDSVVVTCAIDNLVKGAAGGAIQWMNRLWSLPEESGLTSPPPAWV